MQSSTDHMYSTIRTIDIAELSKAWDVSIKAVKSRLDGGRDLTVREISAVARLLGVRTSDLLG